MSLKEKSKSEKSCDFQVESFNYEFCRSLRIVSQEDLLDLFVFPQYYRHLQGKTHCFVLSGMLNSDCIIPTIIATPNLTFRLVSIEYDDCEHEYYANYHCVKESKEPLTLNKYGL